MKRFLLFFAAFIACATYWACRDNPHAGEPGMLSRERSALETEEPETLQHGAYPEGDFESMVADYESQDRVIWQKPDLVIALLGDLEGKTLADIGAGTGYFAFRIVPRAEKVIAIDIDQRFINFMDSIKVRLPEGYQDRFESRLARYDDPLLRPEEVDAVMIVNTYGYIENRIDYLQKIRNGLRPGGQLLIIDFKKNNLPIGPSAAFRVGLSQVENELETAGFTDISIDRKSLDYQYIVQARKADDNR